MATRSTGRDPWEDLRDLVPGSGDERGTAAGTDSASRASADSSPLVRNPEIQGGEPVFRGTRLPVRMLFEHLEWGYTIDEFADTFEGVSPDDARAVLAYVRAALPSLTPESR